MFSDYVLCIQRADLDSILERRNLAPITVYLY